MPKTKRYYETVFIARQDLSTKQAEDLAEKFSKIVNDNGGNVKKIEQWGLRQLAYRINKNRKGHYVLFQMEAPSAAVAEMERNLGLDEDVLRHLTVRIDGIEDGPTVMMKQGQDRYDDFDSQGSEGVASDE